MKEDESVADYFILVQTIANQMKINGEVMIDVVIIEKIMKTLTQRYDHIMVVIEESKDETLNVVSAMLSLHSI